MGRFSQCLPPHTVCQERSGAEPSAERVGPAEKVKQIQVVRNEGHKSTALFFATNPRTFFGENYGRGHDGRGDWNRNADSSISGPGDGSGGRIWC